MFAIRWAFHNLFMSVYEDVQKKQKEENVWHW